MVNEILNVAQHGLGFHDAGLFVARAAVGGFFALSGYNKLTNKGRHATLVQTLKADHVPFVGFNQWFVPINEFFAGAMVALGMFPAFFAGVLMILMAVALCCEGKARVESYQPINVADRVDDWLFLQEVLYMVLLGVVIFG